MIHPIDLTDRKNVPLDVLDGEEGETAKKISLNPSSILFCPTLPFVLYGNLYSLAILGVHWKDKFTHANHNVTWLTFFGIVICVNIVLWSIYLYHQFLSTGMVAEKYGESRSYSSWYQGFLAYALPMCYALLHLLACARLIQRTILEECPEYTECSYESWKYNSLIENGALSYDGVMLCMIMPIVQLTISGHVAFMCAVVCWTITIGTIIAVMVISKDEDCIVYLLAYIIGCIMIAMEIRKFCVYQSWLQKEMTNTMRKSEEEADRANAIEMRHMIANVAHDLKTPLSSFLAGIEYISQVITEMQVKQRQSSGVLSAADIEDFIQSIAQCITNMGNTNSFMLMTINRCIDYTKASKGLKLVPKFETIDLLEALSLPLNCMKDIQNRVAIQLLAIPRDVCSHVITDKQWLQENVLCLLSNAVKYSDGGHVTVSVEKLVNEIDGSPTSRKARSSIKGRSSIIELKGDVAKSRRRSAENNSVSTVVLAHNANRVQTSRSTSSESRGSGDIILFDDDQAFYLRFEVEDHGIGLSDEMMQTLFSPFKQAQRLAGGTGLGLFSLANRVQALGGKCGVSRRRDGGEGSMFWFTIPYQPDRTASQQGPKRRRSSMSLNHMGSSLSDGQTDLMISSKTINVIGMTTSILVSPIRTLDPILSNNCGNSTHSSSPASDSNAAQVDQQMQPPPPPLPPLNTIGSENGDDTCRSHESGGSGEKSGIAEAPSVMQDQGIAVEEDMKTLQILLVDDSPAILKMASMMLRRHKHSVHTATNGAEAVKRIQENMHSHDNLNDGATTLYYDVVLIDLQMPIMDGLEAMRRIRKLEHSGPKCSNVIIGMSANSDEETTAEAYGAGADAFMTKPFSLDTFYDTYDGVMVLKEGGELLKNTEGVAVAPVVPSPPS